MLSVLKILRILRVLRPLRAINRAKGLKVNNKLLDFLATQLMNNFDSLLISAESLYLNNYQFKTFFL